MYVWGSPSHSLWRTVRLMDDCKRAATTMLEQEGVYTVSQGLRDAGPGLRGSIDARTSRGPEAGPDTPQCNGLQDLHRSFRGVQNPKNWGSMTGG